MFTVIDLFCGAGGFSRGFKDLGFEIVLGVENLDIIARTYAENFKDAYVLNEDIQKVSGDDIIKIIGDRPDVIIGGPPCEAFTKANPKRKSDPLDRLYVDPRGQLVLHFIRIVGDLKPKVFVMENVPGLIEGALREALIKEFIKIGFTKIHFNMLYAEDYGTPSHRLRLFISNIPLKPPKIRDNLTVIEVIGDLPSPYENTSIPNHEPISISPRKLKKIRKLKWGEALIRYRGANNKIYTNMIRLHPYRLAPTVMGSSRFIHPFEDRLLTVREHARLMGFPDSHIFIGSKDIQFNEVGEAVPVPLARAIASYVKLFLKGD